MELILILLIHVWDQIAFRNKIQHFIKTKRQKWIKVLFSNFYLWLFFCQFYFSLIFLIPWWVWYILVREDIATGRSKRFVLLKKRLLWGKLNKKKSRTNSSLICWICLFTWYQDNDILTLIRKFGTWLGYK